MSRRLVLVDLPWMRPKDPRVSLPHASLLASLRAKTNVEVRSIVVPANSTSASVELLADLILRAAEFPRADVDVAMGVYVWAEALVRGVCAELRRRGFEGRIILGGPQVTYMGPGVDRLYPDADAFVRGSAEAALGQLAERPGTPTIRGVHYAGTTDRCARATVDLGVLPSPWLDGTLSLEESSFIRWETQRGCPFACSFCQHRQAGLRPRRADFPLSRLLAEVDLFCSSGVQDIAVLDPIFHLGVHAHAVLRRFADRNYPGRLSLQCRAELIDDRFLDCTRGLDVRLEFGLQTIHELEGQAVRRQNNMAKVDHTLAQVQARGLRHEVSLIYGLPAQTLDSFTRSVAWCIERRVPVIKAFPLMLLRGTALDSDRETWGLIEGGEAIPTVVGSGTATREDVLAMARIADALRETEGAHPPLPDLLDLAAATRAAELFARKEAA